jgi:hypothetical protein
MKLRVQKPSIEHFELISASGVIAGQIELMNLAASIALDDSIGLAILPNDSVRHRNRAAGEYGKFLDRQEVGNNSGKIVFSHDRARNAQLLGGHVVKVEAESLEHLDQFLVDYNSLIVSSSHSIFTVYKNYRRPSWNRAK